MMIRDILSDVARVMVAAAVLALLLVMASLANAAEWRAIDGDTIKLVEPIEGTKRVTMATKKHAKKKAARRRKVYRDARTGEFAATKTAKKRPAIHVRETV